MIDSWKGIMAPLAIVLGAYLLALAIGGYAVLRETEGRPVCALDDAYIHMAMAKNLSQHGVYGVTKHRFSSASSSPLWVLLLTFSFTTVGVSDWLPLLLAAAFGAGILLASDLLLRRFRRAPWERVLIGLALIFLTPMLPLVTSGMEHAMHGMLVVLLLYMLSKVFASRRANARETALLCAAALFATAARYETVFMAIPACALLLIGKRPTLSLALALSAAAPIAVHAAISVSHGGHALPNTLLSRGAYPIILHEAAAGVLLERSGFSRIFQPSHIHFACLMAGLAAAIFVSARRHMPEFPLTVIIASAAVLHLLFAELGWFYRYEAYLLEAGIALCGSVYINLIRNPKKRPILSAVLITCAAALLAWPMAERGAKALYKLAPTARRIYAGHYQLGQFLAKAYPGGLRVAMTDIGAACFYGDTDLLDLTGLADYEVLKAQLSGAFDPAFLRGLYAKRNTDLVIQYTDEGGGWRSYADGMYPAGVMKITYSGGRIRRFVFHAGASVFAARNLELLKAFESYLPPETVIEASP